MLMYVALVLGAIVALFAIFANLEEKTNDLMMSIVIFFILYCIVRISNALRSAISLNATWINIAVLLAIIAYIIFLFRKNSIWRQ